MNFKRTPPTRSKKNVWFTRNLTLFLTNKAMQRECAPCHDQPSPKLKSLLVQESAQLNSATKMNCQSGNLSEQSSKKASIAERDPNLQPALTKPTRRFVNVVCHDDCASASRTASSVKFGRSNSRPFVSTFQTPSRKVATVFGRPPLMHFIDNGL